MCADKLTEIIASDHLNVAKEETVFEATMLWLDKSATRRQSFEKVSMETQQSMQWSPIVCVLSGI